MQPQPDARRCFAKIGEKRRAKQRLDAVGQADAEHAIGGAGIEGSLPRHQRLDLRERDPHRVDERQGSRRWAHAVRRAGEKFVAKQRAQAREVVAHRRLPNADARRGPGDAALRKQSVEGDQQVEVEAR